MTFYKSPADVRFSKWRPRTWISTSCNFRRFSNWANLFAFTGKISRTSVEICSLGFSIWMLPPPCFSGKKLSWHVLLSHTVSLLHSPVKVHDDRSTFAELITGVSFQDGGYRYISFGKIPFLSVSVDYNHVRYSPSKFDIWSIQSVHWFKI